MPQVQILKNLKQKEKDKMIFPFEERFQQPVGWQEGSYMNKYNLKIRYGYINPIKESKGVVVILPGRTEFAEKYFETCRDSVEQNLSVYILDWPGQGRSKTLEQTKCYAPNFEEYVEELHSFIQHEIKTDKPLIMLAQSMGANIGLHYIHTYPNIFRCATLCSPLLRVYQFKRVPFLLSLPFLWVFKLLKKDTYAFGEKDWSYEKNFQQDLSLTSDILRGSIHQKWMINDPSLRQGGVTFDWLYESMLSCFKIIKPHFLKKSPLLVF